MSFDSSPNYRIMKQKLLVLLTIPLLLVTMFIGKVNAEAPEPEVPLIEKTSWTKEEVKQIAQFYEQKYNVRNLVATVQCESQFKYNAVNMQDSHRLSKGSWGAAQFSKETFKHYAKEMGADYDDPMNPYQALDVMGYMFSKGQQSNWSCWTKNFKRV